jgi:hypothetical protein
MIRKIRQFVDKLVGSSKKGTPQYKRHFSPFYH